MSEYHVAQLNIARMKHALESDEMADFVNNLDGINALAEQSPGFVWRLQTEEGDATGIDYFGPEVIVNMSVWESLDSLRHFAYRTAHVDILRRKREWFHDMADAHLVLWWVKAGQFPDMPEAEERLNYLIEHGSTQHAFTFRSDFPPPVG